MTGEDVLANIKKLDIIQIADDTINENAGLIADLNAAQLAQGIRSDGSRITPEYAQLTVEIKGTKTGLAAVSDRVTLYDEGDHYRELYAAANGEEFEMGSKDPKSAALQKKYDGDQRKKMKGSIYGLTEDSKDELIFSGLQKSYEEKVEAVTGLQFD